MAFRNAGHALADEHVCAQDFERRGDDRVWLLIIHCIEAFPSGADYHPILHAFSCHEVFRLAVAFVRAPARFTLSMGGTKLKPATRARLIILQIIS